MIKAEWTNKDTLDLQPTCNQLATDCVSRQAVIELIERMKPYHQDADDIAEMIANMPSAQLDTYEALRILDAINSSGRLDYGDYCDLHDAISKIGGAQNG